MTAKITREPRPRIGQKMIAAARFVSQHPGCAKTDVAMHLNPAAFAGGQSGGYVTVNRAIACGLLHATLRNQRGTRVYSLSIAPLGAQLLKRT